MTRSRGRRAHRSDIILVVVLGGAVLVGVLSLVIWLARRSDSGSHPVKALPVIWRVTPIWKDQLPSANRTHRKQEKPRSLDIYLDVSIPMGGFLTPHRSEEFSGFRGLVNQIPDHLVNVAGETTTPVRWFLVASGMTPLLGKPELLTQDLFVGTETRLDQAFQQIADGLDRGDTEMAVVITDLIDTEELVGAMGAAKALSDWSHSGRVRTGEFGLGLLGVRTNYWGVHSQKCGTNDEGIGCWFSEQAQQYSHMTQVVKKPFYVLVLGRDLDHVDQLGRALLAGAQKLKLESHWELLSGDSRERIQSGECRASKADEQGQDQYALLLNEDGSFECRRAEAVELDCPTPDGARPDSLKAQASWESVGAQIQNSRLMLSVDCERLRSEPPKTDLIVTLEGDPTGRWSPVWKNWSAATDEREEDIGRTLRLEEFVEKVWLRPDRILMTSQPILKAQTQ